jgi:hypothetical protein
MMRYYYVFTYDKVKNEFYGRVETVSGYILFEITNTKEISSLIENEIMKHIDDVNGLAQHLRDMKILQSTDLLLFNGVLTAI